MQSTCDYRRNVLFANVHRKCVSRSHIFSRGFFLCAMVMMMFWLYTNLSIHIFPFAVRRFILRQMWGYRPPGQRQRQENAQTPHHLQFPAASATQPAFPANAIPGATRTRWTRRQFGTHPDAGMSFYTQQYPELLPLIISLGVCVCVCVRLVWKASHARIIEYYYGAEAVCDFGRKCLTLEPGYMNWKMSSFRDIVTYYCILRSKASLSLTLLHESD